MNNYQQELKSILDQIDELSYIKSEKRWIQKITEIIEKTKQHQSRISIDNVADISAEYIEKIECAKQELDLAKRNPEKSKYHIDPAKESLRHAKDMNWQMQED